MIRLESNLVASIVLDRPDHRNALTPEMLDTLPTLLDRAHKDGSRAILIRGQGTVFCAGFDLKQCADDPSTMGALLQGLAKAIAAMRASDLPVVLACHGAAIAGGCALLGGADVVVGDENVKLGYPVVRIGVSPAVSAPFLRRSVGDGPARELLLDTRLLNGRQAQELGLVHELVGEPDQVLTRAMEIAAELARKPAEAIGQTKRWLAEVAGPSQGEIDISLAASLSRVGSVEETAMLAAVWGK